ncbi:MAG: 16S rRNA (guanine(527)-N(7))-methyltransferase RsmG [Paracoccaceae bacterium]
MDADGFRAETDVSRETLARLEIFAETLATWTRRINLIAPGTVGDLWHRHILDCWQLWPLRPDGARSWADLGAGGGLPGLVIAAVAAEEAPALRIALVEADTRKAAFLATAARAMGLVNAEIVPRRIEAAGLPAQDVISARALAPLDRLLPLAKPYTHAGTVLLLPKGETAISELTAAERDWHISSIKIPSRTNPKATILRVTTYRQSHATDR